jgi:hypothetical protein
VLSFVASARQEYGRQTAREGIISITASRATVNIPMGETIWHEYGMSKARANLTFVD